MLNKLLLLLAITFSCYCKLNGQDTPTSISNGELKGVVYDSISKEPLASATVAVYTVSDSTLIKYVITDRSGEYVLKQLPVDKAIRITVSFTGYQTFSKKVTCNRDSVIVVRVSLLHYSSELEEIVISGTKPPVMVKGDTLEFNADAFKMKPDAQLEDLMKILPGIVVWGDGTITVNGREISGLLVEGKPFFGKDWRIATRNLPKEIIDKIQVYNKNLNSNIPDSITEVNVLLKKGKNIGAFGKLGVGLGTDSRFDADGSLNFFNKQNQVSIGAVGNNVNKLSDNMDALLLSHTYKGPATLDNINPNFLKAGDNDFRAGGASILHDFIIEKNAGQVNRLKMDFYNLNKNEQLSTSRETIRDLNDSARLEEQSTELVANKEKSNRFSMQYDRSNETNYIHTTVSWQEVKNQIITASENLFSRETHTTLSKSALTDSSSQNTNYLFINLNIGTNKRYSGILKILDNISLRHISQIESGANKNQFISLFSAPQNTSQNQSIFRKGEEYNRRQKHQLTLSTPRFFSSWLNSYSKQWQIGTQTEVRHERNDLSRYIMDKPTINMNYVVNSYLTNDQLEQTFGIYPGLYIKRNWMHSGKHGSHSSLAFDARIGRYTHSLNNNSGKTFQQFRQTFQSFLYEANIQIQRTKPGRSSHSISLISNITPQFPNADQIAPLIDSSNPNFIRKGNPFLREQEQWNTFITFSKVSHRPKKPFSFNVGLTISTSNNFITANNFVDSLARTTNFLVNAMGYRNYSAKAESKKSISTDIYQLQILASTSYSFSQHPIFINGTISSFKNNNFSFNPRIILSIRNWMELDISSSNNFYSVAQSKENNVGEKSFTNSTQLDGGLKILIGSNITASSILSYNRFSISNGEPTDYTLINAYLTYRFSKRKNIEIKAAALDLLKNNKGYRIFSAANYLSREQTNALQQYFMISLNWYLRKFGKK